MQWMSIETAPKDGTEILAVIHEWWEPINGDHKWITSRIMQTSYQQPYGKFNMGVMKQPTHWMPLPPAPEETQ